MRQLFFVIFFVCGMVCFGQETAFRIITHSQGVRVGNLPVAHGMNVLSSKEQLIIPENGYAGVLTTEGYVYKLTRSTQVSEVNRVVRLELGERKIVVTGGGTHDYAGVGFPLAPEPIFANMTRDSLFIFWGWKKRTSWALLPRKGGYTINITDMYDESLKEITTDKNWVVVDLSPFKNREKAIVYAMKGDYEWGTIQTGLIKFVPENTSDHTRTEMENYLTNVDKDFYEYMIHDLNGLRNDVSLTLFKIVRDKRKPADPLLQKYFEWLTTKYALDIIKLD